ncbi:sensor histidine kinase [Paractinoplanes globisporus]|uniref:histidine kinase n=1 Tax=Paractinoplanes globisporus TaxID=113565 RepID=A0ABW6WEN9_9ACTN|nr:HAMP domain-containing sensor histidine kinase [Actinoplanes globisporus]
MSGRVPLRHSLVTRLLVTVIGVLVVAVAATAWLATQTATRAIQQEQGRSLAGEKGVYEALVGYAATHKDWSGAGPLLRDQARSLGRRVTLTSAHRQVIADSAAGPTPVTGLPSATVDPLRLDLGVTGGTETIDARVVGPYRLTGTEVTSVRKIAQDVLTCLNVAGVEGRVVASPTGRPIVATARGSDPKGVLSECVAQYQNWNMPTEEKAIHALEKLTATCLGRPGSGDVVVNVNWATQPPTFGAIDGSLHPRGSAQVRSCLDQSRHAQLEPYTAPPALLFVTDPDTGLARTTFTLSRENVIRIATVTAAILLVTILVTVLLGCRLVRPLRVLTESAARQIPAPVTTRDEIGYLATALNEAMLSRGEAEAQRRAMVGDIAHELRNPLTNVRSWLEAAQDGLARPDAHLLALLHDETVLLQHVIDDLADLASADAGTLSLHPSRVIVRESVDQVVAAHISAAESAGVALTAQVAPEMTIQADPVRLRQVIGNLVANAIRYTPRTGAVTVTAATDAGTVTITVRDTGTGIAADDLPKIFDRFWRADPSRSRTTGGSGLGLAIARQLTRAHGGDIAVTSTVGEGTTFTIHLPAGA